MRAAEIHFGFSRRFTPQSLNLRRSWVSTGQWQAQSHLEVLEQIDSRTKQCSWKRLRHTPPARGRLRAIHPARPACTVCFALARRSGPAAASGLTTSRASMVHPGPASELGQALAACVHGGDASLLGDWGRRRSAARATERVSCPAPPYVLMRRTEPTNSLAMYRLHLAAYRLSQHRRPNLPHRAWWPRCFNSVSSQSRAVHAAARPPSTSLAAVPSHAPTLSQPRKRPLGHLAFLHVARRHQPTLAR